MLTLDALTASWSQPLAPRGATRPILGFADGLRYDDKPRDGAVRLTPLQAAILGAWDAGHRTLVVAGSVQSGKTIGAIAIPALFQIAEDCRPVLIAAPRVEDAQALWTSKIQPLITGSGLHDLLPNTGAGSKRGVPEEMLCSTGCRVYLRGAGGANEAQGSLIHARAVLVTEVDGIAISKQTVKKSRERPGLRTLRLFDRRRYTFEPDSRMVLESTVKKDTDSAILGLWEDGTAARLWHPCPHCDAWGPRDWQHIVYDASDAPAAADSVAVICPACGVRLSRAAWEDSAWRALPVCPGQRIVGGAVVGPLPRVGHWSIRACAWDDPWCQWAKIASEHWDACNALRQRGDAASLRQWVRDYGTTGYRADDLTWLHPFASTADHTADWIRSLDGGGRDRSPPAAIALATRSAQSTYERGAPTVNGVRAAAFDMQERELWRLSLDLSGDSPRLIDWGVTYFCGRLDTPTPDQRRAALDQAAAWADSLGIPPDATGCDVGGRYLDVVDAWLRDDGFTRWAIRGDSRRSAGAGSGDDHEPGWYETFTRDDGRRLIVVEGDAMKSRLLDSIQASADSPIALGLPQGIAATDHLCTHLCAERCLDGVWIATGRNDLHDCARYALALARRRQRHGAAAEQLPVWGR